MIQILKIVILIYFSILSVSANDESSEMLTQDQVSNEDYREMGKYSVEYHACLSKTAYQQIEHYEDSRRLVDFAMKECAVTLETLNNWLEEKKFPESFRRGYIRKISNKAVRNLLPQIMFMMSTDQASE